MRALFILFSLSGFWDQRKFLLFQDIKGQGMTFTTKYKWQKLNKMPSALNIYTVCMNVKIGVAAVNNTFFY